MREQVGEQFVTGEQWLRNIFIGADQGLNAVFRGNPDSTISARTGYMSLHNRSKTWSRQEKIIDWTFKPIDGKGHCSQAYDADSREVFYGLKTAWGSQLMLLTVALLCLPLAGIIRGLVFFGVMKGASNPQ